MRRAALVSMAVVAAVDAACTWPIPSCEEKSGPQEYRHSDIELTVEETGFRLGGKLYASCMELCAAEPGVIEVHGCKPPERVAPGEAKAWRLTCDVDSEVCHLPELLEKPDFGHGRRPEGLAHRRHATTAGAWLAEVARLEAASVPAFERLARELAAHGAPRRLVQAANRSMRDEVVHARMAAGLARRLGTNARWPQIGPLPVRSLEAVAIENAVEGCVSETIGAVLATYQARAARDRGIRRAFGRIARDEIVHAELAFDVFAWADARLGPRQRRRVRAAIGEAIAELGPTAIAAPTPELHELGLPNVRAAERMIAKTHALLWSNIER